MKNNPEPGEFCCLHICLFNNEKAILRTTLTPLRLLFLLYTYTIDVERPTLRTYQEGRVHCKQLFKML